MRSKIEPVAMETPGAAPAPSFSRRMKRHLEKIRALGFEGPKATDLARFNRIVAGEE